MLNHTTALDLKGPGTLPRGLDELRRFVEAYAAGLRHAAELLGGPGQAQAVDELADLLSREPKLGRRARRILDDLLRLVSLELIHDLESEAAAAFSALPPDHPAIPEICLLADGLCAAVNAARDEIWPPATRSPSA